MADNFPLTPGTGRNAATDQVTYSGDSADVQLVKNVLISGAEGSKTVTDIAYGTGTRSSSTQRVTIATDDSVPVTVASIPSHAVTNAGTFATQENGAALTAMQLIDDTVFADDAAVTLGTSKGNIASGVAVQTDGTDPTAVSAEGDAAALRTDMQRNLIVNQTHPRFWHVSADYASAQTNTSVKAAPALH